MNKLRFITFVLIVFSIYFLIHYFVYFRIVKGLRPSKKICNIFKISFFLLATSFFLDKFFERYLRLYPVTIIASIWLGVISIAFTFFVLEFLITLILPNLSRRITIAAIFLTFLISGVCIYKATMPPRVRRINIPIEGLPHKVEGFSIVQLSDLHLEGWKSKRWLEKTVDIVNKLKPDIIAITGDLVDGQIDGSEDFCEILKGLSARDGIFAVTGNHEYYAGIKKFLEFSKKSNIRVLRNENVEIKDAIVILGVEDDTGKTLHRSGLDLSTAINGCDPNKPFILLSHKPKYFKEAVELGIDLQLSGHTHAGQIPPMDLIVFLIYEYPFGLYRHKSSYIYTTCGTGFWGPPMRLFSSPEIIKIVLVKKTPTTTAQIFK